MYAEIIMYISINIYSIIFELIINEAIDKKLPSS